MVSSKNDLCNMAMSEFGQDASISDIDTPKTAPEKVFAKWYDTILDLTLKMVMPNFALDRAIVAKDAAAPVFGQTYRYAKPADCLKVLGIGNVLDKMNDNAIEGDFILSDTDYPDGMPVRFIKRVTTVSKFTPDFCIAFSKNLAAHTCIEITQDVSKAKKLMDEVPMALAICSGLNAQENVPIRVSRSRFKGARTSDNPNYTDKK